MNDKLIKICKKIDYQIDLKEYSLNDFDKFPYIPYIPKQWNKILVLAEAQQLRGKIKGNLTYRKRLEEASEQNQITRLGNKAITPEPEKMIGIWPWDNGYIKLALLAVFPNESIGKYALSNSIPWHLNKNNNKQFYFLRDKSIAYWGEILPILKPKAIICTGEIARKIISKTKYCCEKNKCNQYNLRSASRLHFVAKRDFDIQKYPELISIYNENRQFIIPKQPMRYYIYYMAHAKSKINK